MKSLEDKKNKTEKFIEEWEYERLGNSLDDYTPTHDLGPGNGAYESWSDYWSDRL